MISSQSKEIKALVEDIKEGRLLLPELQRRFVWKSTQVRDLFDSLYHQYPSGQLLVWETEDLPYARTVSIDEIKSDQRHPQLLLDGQQRMTSLAAVILGNPLVVRGSRKPIDIVFNVFTEKFEVAGPRQSKEAGWISLTKLFTSGVLAILIDLNLDTKSLDTQKIFDRLARLENIKTYKYQVNVLEKLSYDEVTHIFVRINSGGTKLGSADLALAQISSRWRGVTEEINAYQWKVWGRGMKLWLDTGILIRALSALLAGQTRLNQLFRGERQKITVVELEATWKRLIVAMEMTISFLNGNCHINRFDLLPTQYVLIPLTVFFDRYGDQISPQQIRGLQRWVYMALIWARYSAAAETAADQDITAMSAEEPLQKLTQNLEDKIGRQRLVTERELRDQRKNSPYMLLAYVLARRAQAQDWFNGVVIEGVGALEFHHIFPKEVLREKYDLKTDSRTVDQVANLAFLSKRANLKIRSQAPAQYLPTVDTTRLKAQNVPTKPEIWTLERFEDFVLERRTLLADAINQLLVSLSDEPALWALSSQDLLETRVDAIEKQMRDLIVNRLTDARAEQAWELLPKELRKSLQKRVETHIDHNPYQANAYETLEKKLEFSQFSDYPKVIEENWTLFENDFGNVELFLRHHKEVTDCRNAFKHNREVSRSNLASAEAGLIWLEDCLHTALLAEEDIDENGNEEDDEDAGLQR